MQPRPAAARRAKPPARVIGQVTTTRPPQQREAPAAPPDLGWLSAGPGGLRDADGNFVRLQGLRCDFGHADADHPRVLPLLGEVSHGERCVAETLAVLAQIEPGELAQLDRRIAARAADGAYTLLRFESRLWLNGHHLKLAKRYRDQPAVMLGLLGRSALAAKLYAAALAVRRFNARAVIWLPLESARFALVSRLELGIGLLWDARLPQRPPPGLMRGSLHQPVLLDGWQPEAHSPLAHDRLMGLCRQGGVGWLAFSGSPWLNERRGFIELTPAARVMQRAVQLN